MGSPLVEFRNCTVICNICGKKLNSSWDTHYEDGEVILECCNVNEISVVERIFKIFPRDYEYFDGIDVSKYTEEYDEGLPLEDDLSDEDVIIERFYIRELVNLFEDDKNLNKEICINSKIHTNIMRDINKDGSFEFNNYMERDFKFNKKVNCIKIYKEGYVCVSSEYFPKDNDFIRTENIVRFI